MVILKPKSVIMMTVEEDLQGNIIGVNLSFKTGGGFVNAGLSCRRWLLWWRVSVVESGCDKSSVPF